ncbi:outer membrane lipoprotein carrier protein LolA [Gilliamella sp. wkB112]|uniref:outer membrane lipoprotein carrier protein LolA n=1 Tax=Gilliamella sp. wkB112 TaxID=3120257 RepID=UPI00080DF188|nr:outer membrane lipoprotein carrier protein LolA [Gilliamella apicola]OCG02244.1 hypothetical protein A9G12_11075 [Gilliamella apicola]
MKQYLAASISILGLFLTTCCQAITLADLQQQFSKNEIVRADFSQDRYINGLPDSLHSTGKMILSQKLGLWWQQLTPFEMILKMNQQRMEQNIADQKPQIITAETQPQLFQFNHLLTAIFTADRKLLEDNFDVTLSEQNRQWTLLLKPKLAPLSKIFQQITLSGEVYLQKIIIDDMQNDKTVISFSNHRTTPLNKNEQLLFK